MPQEKKTKIQKPGKLFIISASSGAGKTSLVQAMLAALQDNYALERIVTYTTREQRGQEKCGKDYFFISVKEFEQKIASGYFIEWSNAYGNYYGSPANIVEKLKKGQSQILIVDIKGAQEIARQQSDAILIWIATKDNQTLYERLRTRNRESSQIIAERLRLAMEEDKDERVKMLYKYTLINDVFDKVLIEFCDLIKKELEVAISNDGSESRY